jgi:hypothetical protein
MSVHDNSKTNKIIQKLTVVDDATELSSPDIDDLVIGK